MHRKLISLLAVVLALASSVGAQSDKIDEYVRAEMKKQRITGVSVAVVQDGKVVKTQGYGIANVELNVPAKPETVYKIGSVSKQFIATGAMLLIEDGKLALTDHISKYLEGTPDTWKEITIRHVLTHTSGLVREAPGFNPLKVQADADLIRTAFTVPLNFAPGAKWEYCNLGYFILAEIITRVSGKPWGEFLEERVFKPAEMNATRTTTVSDIVPNRATGYFFKANLLQNAPEYLALRPSGAFLSTVLDLAKWDALLYTDRILKRSTREEMWKPAADTGAKTDEGTSVQYGFGWFIGSSRGHRLVYHGGSLPGFRAHLLRYVDDKLTIVVLTNGDEARPEVIARGVAVFFLPDLTPSTQNR